jgi:hypothetical protein
MSLFIDAALKADAVITRLAGLALRRIACAIRIERTVVPDCARTENATAVSDTLRVQRLPRIKQGHQQDKQHCDVPNQTQSFHPHPPFLVFN